ncbi:hypothetical protein A6R68_17775, partial [Neotoma lepida]
MVVEEHERKGQLCFEGLCALVPAAEQLESGVINHELYQQLQQGSVLCGRGVAGNSRTDEALKKDLLQQHVAVALLEAQAGTGHNIDPATNAPLTVDEALHAGLLGPELHEKKT